MKKIAYIILIVLFFSACSDNKGKNQSDALVLSISNCAKLHTMQYNIHKILTYDDIQTLETSLFSEKFSIPIPGDRKIAIPIDAVIKCYIDFSKFNATNISIDGDKILITLPDPQIVLSSAKIDYKNVKQHLSWNRSKFSAEEKDKLLRQGRASILSDMAKTDIIEKSRQSAFRALLPILSDIGFKAEDITLRFSDGIEQNPNSEKTIQMIISND